MIKRSTLMSAAIAALIAGGVKSAGAAELIYGFNTTDPTPLDSFKKNYSGPTGGTATQSTTTGVTEGNGALDIHVPSAAGYTQVDVGQAGTIAVPTDLGNASSLNLDLTFNPGTLGTINYEYLEPIFYLEGGGADNKLTPDQTTAGNAYLGAKVYTGTTLTYNLDSYLDPNAGDGIDTDSPTQFYTPAQIVAANQTEYPGSTLVGFTFEEIDAGSSTPLDFYIDNVTVPSAAVPEPASLGGIALGGLLLARRRRASF